MLAAENVVHVVVGEHAATANERACWDPVRAGQRAERSLDRSALEVHQAGTGVLRVGFRWLGAR